MPKKQQFVQDTIALVYDFDGTLSPQPMQEYTVLPKLGIKPADFWAEVNHQSQKYGEESMPTYMRLLLEKAEQKQAHIGWKEFNELGKLVRYFPGVESWFDRVNTIVKTKSKGKVKVSHYIISAGLREIINGFQ